MRGYQVLALVLVATAVGFVAGSKAGRGTGADESARAQGPPPESGQAQDDVCCAPAPASGRNVGPAPEVPTGSGLPCLLELGSDECQPCQLMEDVLHQVADKLAGKLDVVVIDTDLYPEEATRWRLRLIPTQILLDADGTELWRHESDLPADELLASLSEAGIDLTESTQRQ